MFVAIKRKNTQSQDKAEEIIELDEGEPISTISEGPFQYTFHASSFDNTNLMATVTITQRGTSKQNKDQSEECTRVVSIADRNNATYFGTVFQVGKRTFLAKAFRLNEAVEW